MNIQAINAAYGNTYDAKRPENKSVPALHKDIKGETVEISDQSSELQKLKTIVDESPEIRIDIVRKIKARIKSNDYPLENNLNEVVKRMIQNSVLKPY